MPPNAPFFDSVDRVRRPALALALLVPMPTVGALMGLWIAPGPIGAAVYSLAKVWILALPLIWTLAVDRRTPLPAIAAARPVSTRGILVGIALGLIISIGIFAVYRAVDAVAPIDAHALATVARDAGFGSPLMYLFFGAYLALVNSLLEEYVWRWFTFRAAAAIVPPAIAVPLSALFFTLHHIIVLAAYFPPSLTALASLGVFIGGCAWSWCFLRFRSIIPGYISHAIVDVAILLIGSQLISRAM